ncbi:hypothetical protein F5X96DRAFT_657838 [Biscogniauxia mediterranea]|nr:hypothetical protein F5X96DRAFT_657838 [Biscogniauxia mediterranea]
MLYAREYLVVSRSRTDQIPTARFAKELCLKFTDDSSNGSQHDADHEATEPDCLVIFCDCEKPLWIAWTKQFNNQQTSCSFHPVCKLQCTPCI